MRTPIAHLPGRYTPTVINGAVQHVRNKATLRADIVELLRAEGRLPKKRIITALHTVKWLVDATMDDAEAEGEIERFRALSSRGRMDEFWCLAGQAPSRPTYNIRSAEILAAFQAAAAVHYSINPEGACRN